MWLRVGLRTPSYEDPRPVEFPPPGPYWVTGSAMDESYATLVAYVKSREQIEDYWPEAEIRFEKQVEEVTFTDRFPEPEWWSNEQ